MSLRPSRTPWRCRLSWRPWPPSSPAPSGTTKPTSSMEASLPVRCRPKSVWLRLRPSPSVPQSLARRLL
eukprot:6005243-Lingulodinium_polyedra.AAC.1